MSSEKEMCAEDLITILKRELRKGKRGTEKCHGISIQDDAEN